MSFTPAGRVFELFDTGVRLHAPPSFLFDYPDRDPPTLAPPTECDWLSLKCPFEIDNAFFRAALDYKVPIAFAASYFTLVLGMNVVNRRRKYRPWGFSQTRAFFLFTVLHNIALAAYSAVTFAAMVRMVREITPGWPGEHGLAGAADSLCKLHGPRGYGDAVTFSPATGLWTSKNNIIRLAADGLQPDATDVGRIWNEGLAWWGFWFYLSKYYEVFDTAIILAKGKRSSTLQTYHHTGAMFCMWAGIRYMAAPIYMFVLINSFIHSLMYTFYTISTLGYKVPQRLKQTITTLQILQLLTGVFYASAHLFVSFDVPVTNVFRLAKALASPHAASEAVSSLVADATQAAQRAGDLPPWVKRLAYRAAGAEALAESVHDGHVYTDRHALERRWHAANATEARREEWEHRTHHEAVTCLDTPGQAFAVMLNVAYLLPLMGLFIRFFVKSYLRKGREEQVRGAKGPRRSFNEARKWSESAQEAAKETADSVEFLGESAESAIVDEIDMAEGTAEEVKGKLKDVKGSDLGDKAKAMAADASKRSGKAAKAAKKSLEESTSSIGDSFVQVKEEAQELVGQATGSSKGSSEKQASSSSSTSTTTGNNTKSSSSTSSSASKQQTSSSSHTSSSTSTSTSNTTSSKMDIKSEGEWMTSSGRGSKKSSAAKEPKDVLVPDPSAADAATTTTTTSGEHDHLSYAGAVKEDLDPNDHGEQPKPIDGSMGFGLNG